MFAIGRRPRKHQKDSPRHGASSQCRSGIGSGTGMWKQPAGHLPRICRGVWRRPYQVHGGTKSGRWIRRRHENLARPVCQMQTRRARRYSFVGIARRIEVRRFRRILRHYRQSVIRHVLGLPDCTRRYFRTNRSARNVRRGNHSDEPLQDSGIVRADRTPD